MPAFRWVVKSTGELVVLNHPKSAIQIERKHSDGNGLLANNGSSYANLFTGDSGTRRADNERRRTPQGEQAGRRLRAVLLEALERHPHAELDRRRTVPRATRRVTRSVAVSTTGESELDLCPPACLHDDHQPRRVRERRAQRHGGRPRDLHRLPRLRRGVAPLRPAPRGHSPRPPRHQPPDRSFRACSPVRSRPYRIVVLSDHGQTQGATFEERYDESLAALVGRLCGAVVDVDDDSDAGRTESSAWLRSAPTTSANCSDPRPSRWCSPPRQSRSGVPAARRPSADARGDRRPVPGSRGRTGGASRSRVRARSDLQQIARSSCRQPGVVSSTPVRSRATIHWSRSALGPWRWSLGPPAIRQPET